MPAKYVMRIHEVITKPSQPKPPKTPDQARIAALKQGLDRSKAALDAERDRQRQQREAERNQKRLAKLSTLG